MRYDQLQTEFFSFHNEQRPPLHFPLESPFGDINPSSPRLLKIKLYIYYQIRRENVALIFSQQIDPTPRGIHHPQPKKLFRGDPWKSSPNSGVGLFFRQVNFHHTDFLVRAETFCLSLYKQDL